MYISHPYKNDSKNLKEVTDILNSLQKAYPSYMFISPVNMYSSLYDKMDYQEGLNRCIWLLDLVDEMWVFGDYKSSKGCNAEIDYCNEHNIPYQFFKIVDFKSLKGVDA